MCVGEQAMSNVGVYFSPFSYMYTVWLLVCYAKSHAYHTTTPGFVSRSPLHERLESQRDVPPR